MTPSTRWRNEPLGTWHDLAHLRIDHRHVDMHRLRRPGETVDLAGRDVGDGASQASMDADLAHRTAVN
ncbi:MAG: hypothetical protein EA388_14510 [Nitriliruptor sp.]|nr:MAG: hypothetical protein EA388_14510 [Nitriliruptor sp.]